MIIKQRGPLVITISSLVIASVLALTLFGFYAYLEWKQKNIEDSHRLAVYEFDARLFGKYIIVYLEAKTDAGGIFKGKPVVEGTIKNTSNKTIYSLKLKIALRDREDKVIYADTFYPVWAEPEFLINIASGTDTSSNVMAIYEPFKVKVDGIARFKSM